MTIRYSLMFISCWKSQFDLRQPAAVLRPSDLLWKVPLSNPPNSLRLCVDPRRHLWPLLGKRKLDFFLCTISRGRKKHEMSSCAFTSQGHRMQQISTSNQFISKALSKLLQTRFWCKNPSVLSAWSQRRVCADWDFSVCPNYFLLSAWTLVRNETFSNINQLYFLCLNKPNLNQCSNSGDGFWRRWRVFVVPCWWLVVGNLLHTWSRQN